MIIERKIGFAVPAPARVNISKLLLSESVRDIDSPMITDHLAGLVVRSYKNCVGLKYDRLIL